LFCDEKLFSKRKTGKKKVALQRRAAWVHQKERGISPRSGAGTALCRTVLVVGKNDAIFAFFLPVSIRK